ncbi:MAG TPA: ATP-binding protein [Usitatibacter sp.]|nr:ATP-binding protein [Usitatibacter sp.]
MEAVLTPMNALAMVVSDSSHVSSARLALQRLARDLEFDETRAGRVAIVATEAVSNMIRHGGGGTLAARPLVRDGALGIEMLAIDTGRGMRDFAGSAVDGVSTGGTPGTGLGAIRRLTDEFEVRTGDGRGTVMRMVLWNRVPGDDPSAYEVGAVLVPKEGESACGDAWAMEPHVDGVTFVVSDGLGHGIEASRASALAVEALRSHPEYSAIRMLDLAHGRLRHTRGAALGVIRHERSRGEVVFAGVGNISVTVIEGETRRAMVSHNGIVGHNMARSEEYRYPWPRGSLLVAHSDGLESRWDLAAFPGIVSHHASIIAATLYASHTRKRDDVVVMVARETR